MASPLLMRLIVGVPFLEQIPKRFTVKMGHGVFSRYAFAGGDVG
jgi:hypothetical protein